MKEACEDALCPCESGRRYIECCLERHVEKGRGNPIQEINEELKKEMAARNFANLDEANRFLRDFYTRRNGKPSPDFLGLSPDQVHRLIDLPLTHAGDIVLLSRDFSAEDMTGIPAVSHCIRFLNDLASSGRLKETAAGYLPREFARRLFDDLDQSPLKPHIKFRTETDSGTVHFLRLILGIGGWMKKEKGRFSLTRKGEKAVRQGFSAGDYLDLFSAFAFKFNWGYQDGFPEFRIIQQGVLFSLYLLHKKARGFVDNHSLSPFFIRAFPMILPEARPSWGSAFYQVNSCYSVRFLERFCLYMGLIELREKQRETFARALSLKTSPFFDRLLTWKV